MTAVYQRNKELFVHSLSQTTTGLWILNEPVVHPTADSASALGSAIRECLAASRQNVAHPTDFSGLFDPVLRVAGVRSYKSFVQSARLVNVEMSDAAISVWPTRNLGSKEGFVPKPGAIEIVNATDEEMGRAAAAALEEAEWKR